MKFIRVTTLSVLVISALLSGCAVFRGNELPEFGSLPAPAASAQKPGVGYEFKSSVNMGETKAQNETARAQLETEFAETLRASGYFASVDKGMGKGINVSAELVETANPAALAAAVVTGLSLYTIPSWATTHMEATFRVTTADGRTREYKLKDSATLVQWLPMMVVFPFKPFSEIAEMRKNIYRNLIVKMREDGLLPKAGQGTTTGGIQIRIESPAV